MNGKPEKRIHHAYREEKHEKFQTQKYLIKTRKSVKSRNSCITP
jgi:hypothetical protein